MGASGTENKGKNVTDAAADKLSSRFCSAPTDLAFVVVYSREFERKNVSHAAHSFYEPE